MQFDLDSTVEGLYRIGKQRTTCRHAVEIRVKRAGRKIFNIHQAKLDAMSCIKYAHGSSVEGKIDIRASSALALALVSLASVCMAEFLLLQILVKRLRCSSKYVECGHCTEMRNFEF